MVVGIKLITTLHYNCYNRLYLKTYNRLKYKRLSNPRLNVFDSLKRV